MPYAAIPTRTRSRWVSGSSSAAAELATWRPAARPADGPLVRPVEGASWIATDTCSGWSEAARWDQTPITSSAPDCSASAAAAQTSAPVGDGSPVRDSPVSILSCTRARCSTVPAAAARREIWSIDWAETSTSAATSGARSSSGRESQARTRPVSPASRIASASLGVATPSHLAPAVRAAWAQGSIPWP